ncbi:Oligopeptide transport ATP-binding protein OppF [compost metagenome]
MVKYISDRIAVMFRGKIVELGEAKELYRYPLHPYTESLLSSIPYPDPDYEKQRTRLVYKQRSQTEESKLHEVVPGHYVYCTPSEIPLYQAKHENILTVSNTSAPSFAYAFN